MRTVPREALATKMRRTDAAVCRAAAAVFQLASGLSEYGADLEGPAKVCSMLGRQIMLPLRHGGLGLHMQRESLGRCIRGRRRPSRAPASGDCER